jgi:hypothetical protein
MPSALKQPAQRQPLVSLDPQTKSLLITREWYNFLLGLYDRVGGALGDDNAALAQGLSDDAGIEELKHTVLMLSSGLEQSLSANAQLRSEVDELRKAIQALQQNTLI